ncbi:MAG: aminopeptidase N [Chlamydiota bacterium]
MKNAPPKATLLEDYRPLPFKINTIHLTFELDDKETLVTAVSQIERERSAPGEPLKLNGERLKLVSLEIDGRALDESDYSYDERFLMIHETPESFELTIKTEINPSANTTLEGLYKSGTIFCTQNEPEGFRRITYFLDRPDIMSVYTTTIIADKNLYPILLSNGNKVESGDLEDGRHWVKWNDPFPKPSYLYALVAGDLGEIRDTFRTISGRDIDLHIFCDKGNESKCEFAMNALKKSMKWDEEVYGLEYDLDIFMIVAVDAFNFGAMENKGLNIFNTSCVLADKSTATDDNFYRVEGVVAHEYFHNWTGNRVTCRDWFQLTLKEGLTVFRDQEFSADMNSRAVKRIEDVESLRAAQFAEDAGPTAHPIKPKSYIEINNFYTATIYDKGAEVIRMIHTMLGKENFRKGIDKYFELYDGQAVTTEDFIHAMEQASGVDLKPFTKWYHQSGTPELDVSYQYDSAKQSLKVDLIQKNPSTADEQEKHPLVFPLACGILSSEGSSITPNVEGARKNGDTVILPVSKESQTFVFENVSSRPTLSVNRGFSAPIKVHVRYEHKDLMFLMAHDHDEFNRWDASQELGIRLMLESLQDQSMKVSEDYLEAYGKVLKNKMLDPGLKALCLTLPTEGTLGQRQSIIDFDGNHHVRETYLSRIATHYQNDFIDLYEELSSNVNYQIDPESIGKRSLRKLCLKYIAQTEKKEALDLCLESFKTASNMTDQYGALRILADYDCEQRKEALEQFYQQWKGEQLVMCKWLTAQASSKAKGALDKTEELTKDVIYDQKIPNLVRALFGGFMQNHVQFHDSKGAGYAFIVEQISELDKINPHVSARLATGFRKFGQLDSNRRDMLRKELDVLLSKPDISPHLYEIVSKCVK